MSTLTNNGDFITIVNDFGETKDFRKSEMIYLCQGAFFIVKDYSGRNESLKYSDITAPTSSDIYDLRDQITVFIST